MICVTHTFRPSVGYLGLQNQACDQFLMHYGLVLWRGGLHRWNRGRIVGGSWEVMLQRQQMQEGGTWCCCRVGTRQTTESYTVHVEDTHGETLSEERP